MEARDAAPLKYKKRVFPSTSFSIILITKINISPIYLRSSRRQREIFGRKTE
jgi:hypothetical protein